MNDDVCLIPTPHPPAGVSLWCETSYTACLNPSETDTVKWSSTRPLVQNRPHPVRERMERSGAHHATPEVAAEADAPLDARAETQLDLFHKLGYSTAQVRAVLQKFGLNTDTNRVLGELVRTCAAGPGENEGPVTTMSVLVSRGDRAAKTPIGPLPLPPPQYREQEAGEDDGQALRLIVIDGSNVAMSHGNKEVFSCLGIQLAVQFFLDRGHSDITVFVPLWRREQPRPAVPITDQHILRDLERRKILVFTPSRRVAGKRVVCYDDRFIVKLAYESDGIIVSNDTYRDLQGEKPEWKRFIEDRLLMYSFVNDKFMPPDDPLGRHGPTLDNFLRRVPRIAKKQPCPYGKKCTYGVKCKFHHPERTNQSHRSLADELREKARQCSSPHKPPAAGSGPGPAHGVFPEEELAQKVTLERWSGSLKKGQMSENVILVKGGHRSSRRAPSRKEKSSHHSLSDLDSVLPSGSDLDSVLPSGSQEQWDSGLGSIESQPTDAPWDHGDHRYSDGYRSCQSSLGMKQHYNSPPQDTPCSGCSRVPPSLPASHHNRHPSMGPASTHRNPDIVAYRPPHYPSYCAPVYPANMHAYSHPGDFQHGRVHPPQQQVYWSDPYGVYPQPLCSRSGEGSHWEPPPKPPPSPRGVEREGVRKKLLAIFNARVVDRAMDMFPQLMDPQMLAAEILMLQSQDMTLR